MCLYLVGSFYKLMRKFILKMYINLFDEQQWL